MDEAYRGGAREKRKTERERRSLFVVVVASLLSGNACFVECVGMAGPKGAIYVKGLRFFFRYENIFTGPVSMGDRKCVHDDNNLELLLSVIRIKIKYRDR